MYQFLVALEQVVGLALQHCHLQLHHSHPMVLDLVLHGCWCLLVQVHLAYPFHVTFGLLANQGILRIGQNDGLDML